MGFCCVLYFAYFGLGEVVPGEVHLCTLFNTNTIRQYGMSNAPFTDGNLSTQPAGPSSTSTATASSRKAGSRSSHHEDVLLRSWRSTAHGVALVTSKAERVVAVASAPDCNTSSNDAAMKDLNDATIGFLRNHVEWGRSISYIEAKLEGKAAEMEAMQHYLRSHPSMGRKRKRAEVVAAAKR